ncbi:MAG: hypothetical protein E6R04_06300 [Spirochaetes bacterium]|nr:MAG: hypothetical protein E6R04_06300 [Spirochaetota bacterium]
MRCALCGTMGR